jgi:hypothetical protein
MAAPGDRSRQINEAGEMIRFELMIRSVNGRCHARAANGNRIGPELSRSNRLAGATG